MTDSIFALHESYDLANASDGRSRYGAYLAQHTQRFREWNSELTPLPAEFAAAAFVIATPPIMSPPYVTTHPRVVSATPRWDEDRRCALVVDLATPIADHLADRLPVRAVDWDRDATSGRYLPTQDNHLLAAYSWLTVRIPLPVDLLPEPAYTDTGTAETQTAKRALRTVTNHANSVLTHLIVTLDS